MTNDASKTRGPMGCEFFSKDNLLVVLNGAGHGHADVKHLAVSLRVGVIASYDLVATSEGSFRHVLLRVSGWWSLQPENTGSERRNHCHRMGIGRIKARKIR